MTAYEFDGAAFLRDNLTGDPDEMYQFAREMDGRPVIICGRGDGKVIGPNGRPYWVDPRWTRKVEVSDHAHP